MDQATHQVPSLLRAVRLVEAVAAGRARSLPALQRLLDIPAASAYRIVQTLLGEGWLERGTESGDLLLGNGLRALAGSPDPYESLRRCLAPDLAALQDATGLTSKLSVRDGDEFLMLARAESTRPLSLTARIGARESLAMGSAGAALLAGMTDKEAEQIITRAPASVWKHQSEDQLRQRVSAARRSGVCADIGETHGMVATLSARLGVWQGREAVLTVIGLPDDVAARQDSIRTELVRTAQRALGRRGVDA